MTQLKLISMDQVPVEEVQWLWYPYIPYGKLTIIHGDPGEGKTTLILRLAALLSQGKSLPCDDRPQEPVKIIYQTAEDSLLRKVFGSRQIDDLVAQAREAQQAKRRQRQRSYDYER